MHFCECLKLARTERNCEGVSKVDNSLQKNLEGHIGPSRLLQFVSMAPCLTGQYRHNTGRPSGSVCQLLCEHLTDHWRGSSII